MAIFDVRIWLLACALWALILWPVLAQEKEKPELFAFTKQEQATILSMCDLARWASRVQFDGVCEGLKQRFAAPVEQSKPADEKK